MNKVKVDDRDWSKLNFGQHVYQLEVEGYTVIPDLLSAEAAGQSDDTDQRN